MFPQIEIESVEEQEDGSAIVTYHCDKETKEWLCGYALRMMLEKYLEEEIAKEAKDD